MSFIRPEVRDTLFKWREVLVGNVLLVLAVYWIVNGIGILRFVGIAVLIVSILFIVAGIQRAKFRVKGVGAGVVQVTEKQVTYFGPLNGGALAIDDLIQLDLDPTHHPANWVLRQAGHDPIHIPVTAKGSDALFDVFGNLPNINTKNMLEQLTNQPNQPNQPVVIWQKMKPRLH